MMFFVSLVCGSIALSFCCPAMPMIDTFEFPPLFFYNLYSLVFWMNCSIRIMTQIITIVIK